METFFEMGLRLGHRPLAFAAVAGIAAVAIPNPSHAFTVYTAFDPNGNQNVNLLSTTGIPNSNAAQTAFLSRLVGAGTETFESFSPGTSSPLAITFPGAGTATLSGIGNIQSTPAGITNGFGRYGVSPTNYWETSAGTGSANFTIEFTDNIAAFGFYGIDLGDFQGTLRLKFDNGLILEQPVPTAPQGQADGSVLFWGLVAEPSDGTFKRVEFLTTGGTGDTFAFDNMTIGAPTQVVPPTQGVPGPLGVVGLGGAFAWSRRLRRRCATHR